MSNQYLGTFEQAVLLGLAGAEGETDGMAIVRAIESATEQDVSVPAVYVTLKRLEKKGLVTSRIRPSDGETAANRKHFTLQPAGAAELAKAKRMLDTLWSRAHVDRLGGKT